jgi:hypothetical protein
LRPRPPIPDAERPFLVRFALTFATLIVGWAVAHDLYLIHLEPRHFTEHHRPLLPVTDLRLLALQYAVVATLGPGLVFGFCAWLACRAGPRAPIPLRRAAPAFACVIASVEALLLLVGMIARRRVEAGLPPLYPLWAYPDLTPGIVVSQTINLSAYLVAPASGALCLLALFLRRPKKRSSNPTHGLR